MSRNDAHDRHEANTPDPDHPAKPDSPSDITKPSWKYVLRKTVREFSDDQCTDLAAALTYYAVLASAPALLALVSILGLVGDGGQLVELGNDIAELKGFAPDVIDGARSQKSGKIYGWNKGDWGKTVSVDKDLEDVNVADYDALVLPGGQINPDKLRL